MRTRKISQLEETTGVVNLQDQITLVNSSPLQNYKVSVDLLSQIMTTTTLLHNEIDGGFADSVAADSIDANLGA
jgi:hypothetical protein|tara:strand:- start:128 stop:349 length:222 start_codon:yes stop_codon:yes gene_type:complete